MSIQFVMGGAGTGKTQFLYDEIIEMSMKDPDQRILIIVPEQFTMQTQKDIVTKHPNKGILKIEVLSFGRLAYRIFEEVGLPNKKTLDDMGKSLVLRKVMSQQKNELEYFNKMTDKVGFIDGLKTLVTEFYQYQYSLEELKGLENKFEEEPILASKLRDIHHIFDGFIKYIENNYITTEQTLDLLGQRLNKSRILRESILVFDGFYGYTPQQYSVIEEIARYCKKLYFGLTVEEQKILEESLDTTELFYESKKTYQRIMKIAEENSFKVDKIQWLQKPKESGIRHMAKELFAHPYKAYKGDGDEIKVVATVNPEKESGYISRQIHELVYQQGYDYRDIAVLTGDLDCYKYFIQRFFQLHEIPFFIDVKKDIYQNPLVECLRSVLEVFVHNWNYESVFRFLKVGYAPLDREEIDGLENFVLKYGIQGHKSWVEENWFERYKGKRTLTEYKERQLEFVEDSRNEVVKALDHFRKAVGTGSHTVRTFTTELYHLLIHLEVPQQLKAKSKEFEAANEMLLKREYDQIWKITMDLFDKMVEILGEEKVGIKEYAKLLDAGLEQCEFGLVPPSLNQVVVGDLERSRLHNIKALFILGLNDGLIPSVRRETGILSDEERELINGTGKEIADSNKKKVYEEHFLVYNALSKPSDLLMMTYSLATMDGHPERPSFLIKQMEKILPKLQQHYDDPALCQEDYITLPHATLPYLIKEKRKELDRGTSNPLWGQVENWYRESPEWNKRLEGVYKGFNHNNMEKHLEPASVEELYGNSLKASISQLENYASCPFSYYIRYGLKAKEREHNEIKAPEIGVFFHLVLESFSRKLQKKGWQWADISEEQKQILLDKTLEEVTPLMEYSAFMRSSRSRYFQYRLTKITKKAIDVLGQHLERGDFNPQDFELGFGEKDKLPAIHIPLDDGKEMSLTGKIDRVDLLDQGQDLYVKVIDYKSGNQGFDMVAIYNGLQLQLIVYLDALIELGDSYYGKPLRPAGIFYFKVDDPLLSVDQELSSGQLMEKLLAQFKLSGLVLSDPEVVKSLDKTLETSSSIIPVRLTSKGNFHKSHSSVASEEDFKVLRNFAKKKARDLGKEILGGNISIEPFKLKDRTGCDFCPYHGICQFDLKIEGNCYHLMDTIKKDLFYELLKEKLEKE